MRINPLLTLPIVRTRRLPAASNPLQWRETGDLPAAIVVFVVAALGAVLGAAIAVRAVETVHGVDRALLVSAFALLLPCLFALLAALAEFTRVRTVSIENGTVFRSDRQLGRGFEHAQPLSDYQGLFIFDRTRRLFIRNQDHPLTGRRGPVTEFIIVLRHRTSGAFDVELFRAQPSLTTLLTMHRMQDAASGRASAANASACAELAASYRHALTQLCEQLNKPALLADADKVVHEWPVSTLDHWLQAPPHDSTLNSRN
jgi:hypothetical protein